MTTATVDSKALLAVPAAPKATAASTMVEVARAHGVSPIRQLRESVALSFGRSRMKLHEYYAGGLYDPALTARDKREFVGERGSYLLNSGLASKRLTSLRGAMRHKVLHTAMMETLGFRTTKTQAVVSDEQRFGSVETCTDAASLRDFLMHRARFPLFGKPQSYSGSFGSALIESREGDDLILGNGKRIRLDAFCEEIVAEYASGYVLQSALRQHPVLEEAAGRAVGTIRIVTVRRAAMPEVLYTLWKIPAPTAMSDNFWQDGSMIAPIDPETGIVGQVRAGSGVKGRNIDTHPATGATLTGLQLPDWQAALTLAREGHAVMSEFGVIGWDIALTPAGPAIIEANANPHHMLYQLAHRRGIWNTDFAPVWGEVRARSKAMLRRRIQQELGRVKKRA
ncbi:MAG: hypothetical protein CML02_18940 [Pseudooceanicola sp.]|nr:hypothetical protein [Pseudooceanicola sp.]